MMAGGKPCDPIALTSAPNRLPARGECGIEIRLGWGITELSPIGRQGTLKGQLGLPREDRLRVRGKQSRPVYGTGSATSRDGN
jgi:hypothetical protein